MKKLITCLFMFFCSLHICGCIKQSIINTSEIFPPNFFEEVKYINFYNFDGTIITCDDYNKIHSVLTILRDANYELINEENYVEGFYIFEFVTHTSTVSIGIENHHIAINGQQYFSQSQLSNTILQTLKIN